MTAKAPNHRLPNPLDEIVRLRADVDELLRRGNPAPPPRFVREVVLPIQHTGVA